MVVIIWSLLALALAGLVVFSNQLEFLVPAVAAFAVALLALVPGLREQYLVQAIVWALLSVGGFVLFRRKLLALKRPRGGSAQDSVAGKKAVVTEALGEGEPGRVRFQGTTWIALSAEPVAVGCEVEILGQEGLVLSVQQVSDDRLARDIQALRAPTKEE
jgi:membrane protein implicated in regulation of membrane protease activity